MPAGKRKREDSGAASKGAPKLKEDGERSSALMAEAAQYLHVRLATLHCCMTTLLAR
jgi:hypothetical protein